MAAPQQLFGPRCDRCETMLVHIGAMCIACDEDHLFIAPHLTVPPIRAMADTNRRTGSALAPLARITAGHAKQTEASEAMASASGDTD